MPIVPEASARPCHYTLLPRIEQALDALLSPRRVLVYPLALLLVTTLIYVAGLVRLNGLIQADGSIIGQDYLAFYMAGDMVRTGNAQSLYIATDQAQYQRDFMQSRNPRWRSTCLYLNPPHYAWAMSWISPLGYSGSLAVWAGLSLAAFVATFRMWQSWLKDRAGLPVVVLAVCMPAWFQALAGGQNTFFSLLILTGFCYLVMRGKDFWAGLVLSLLAYKFHLLALPAAYLLFRLRWRALAGLVSGGAATLALTAICLGPHVWIDYVRFVPLLGRLADIDGFGLAKQHSFYGMLALLAHDWTGPGVLRAAAMLLSLGTVLWLVPAFRGEADPGSLRLARQLAVLLVATALTSPHLFHYDMLLLVLPAVLWHAHAPAKSSEQPTRRTLAVGFAYLAVSATFASATHLQLSPFLMLLWLSQMRSRLVTPECAGESDVSLNPHFPGLEVGRSSL